MEAEGSLEFVSPVFDFQLDSTHKAHWREYTTELFLSISSFALMNNPETACNTATHVHISPIDRLDNRPDQ